MLSEQVNLEVIFSRSETSCSKNILNFPKSPLEYTVLKT